MNSKDTLTRNYIFEAYYELLKKQAYQDINVCDICTKAGVSRMSFYRNFKSKDDLTQKAIERIISNLKQSLKKCEPLNQINVTNEIVFPIKINCSTHINTFIFRHFLVMQIKIGVHDFTQCTPIIHLFPKIAKQLTVLD